MPDPVKKAREVKQRFEREWLAISGVTAVGIGQVGQNRPGIIVSVTSDAEKIRKQIPPDVEGVPVKIQISGILRTSR